MDDFSGYNQIKMQFEDEKHSTFRTPMRIYCYTVLFFGLNNIGATYQHAKSWIFHDHLRQTLECDTDNIFIKSRNKGDRLHYQRAVFDSTRAISSR